MSEGNKSVENQVPYILMELIMITLGVMLAFSGHAVIVALGVMIIIVDSMLLGQDSYKFIIHYEGYKRLK